MDSTAKKPSSSSDKVRRLVPHTEDTFKFDPTVKKSEPPDIDSIEIDPDNQFSEDIKMKFFDINKKYKHIVDQAGVPIKMRAGMTDFLPARNDAV